ncbi:MAG: PaaI family thioesterase [Magnetovibrio sp.]|nr:PaaI family thioesterase [Magnetovibrio sp.]
MPENKMTEAELAERLRVAPFHKWLGLELTEMTEDGIEIRVPWREEFVVNVDVGYTHGGILATLIDVAADYAIAAKLGRPVPTIDMRVDYHRAAMKGDLVVHAQALKLGGSFSTGEAQVYDEAGKLLASGRGVYFTAPPK